MEAKCTKHFPTSLKIDGNLVFLVQIPIQQSLQAFAHDTACVLSFVVLWPVAPFTNMDQL